jgi:hypothetical protein
MDNNYKVNINLNNLRTEVSKREDRKNKTFDKLVEMCYSKIINTNKTSNEYSCIFEVPNLVFGLPLYNINDAIKYIMIKLIDKGFEVHLAIPNKIFISWKPESEKLSSYCRDLYQLDNPNKLSLEYYPITNNPNLQYNPSIHNKSPSHQSYQSKSKNYNSKSHNNKEQKIYRPIEDYKNFTTSSASLYQNDDDIDLFRSKIDELFS